MFPTSNKRTRRQGGIYIVVLGTSLIVATLGLAALVGQRLQNKMLTASVDVRQAQLNAHAAVDLALLTMKQDANWRTTQTNGVWFTGRSTGAGTCSLSVTDPLDANLTDDANEPVTIRGIGYSGKAEQRYDVTADARRPPADVLRASANAGGLIAGQSSVDWNTVSSTYTGTAGATPITYASLPLATDSQFELGRNISFDNGLDDWDDDPPGLPDADFAGPLATLGHAACMRVDRSDRRAGAGNRLQSGLMKPNTTYQVSVEVYTLLPNWFNVFMIVEYANGTYVEAAGTLPPLASGLVWNTFTTSITTPAWTEEPANVYLVVNSDRTGGLSNSFYIDNIHVYEDATGRFLFRQALGPTVANPNGIYTIDCGGSKLTIERSRILGTLVVVNPGAGSNIGNGPIFMAPATPGYPSLLVKGDFAIRATTRSLNEAESNANYNPGTMPFDFGTSTSAATDGNLNDSYPSEIRGLVAVSGNLTFTNTPRIRGQLVVGGSVTGTSGLEYRSDSLLSPPPGFQGQYLLERRPISGRKSVLP
jgi:hypothetical protein